MSSQNVENVHRAYKAFQERDFDVIAELSDPDVEFTSLIRESEGEVYRGHEGLRAYLEAIVDVLPDWTPQVEAVEDHGDRMLVKARIHATPPGGSVPMEQVSWQAIRFRDEKAVRWDFFRTQQEARAALES